MTKSLSKAIALATLVGVSASAHAVNVNHDGLGEVLLYSLYTSEEGNVTNINITNTTGEAKAVKVRFLEGQNSQEVLDFNLFLSEYDQWSGAVTQTADGAKLITADKSCTAPAIPAGGIEFRDYVYSGELNDGPSDGGETTLARTRVGHIEVIEMGVLDETVMINDKGFVATSGGTSIVELVTADHSKAGQAPAGCGTIRTMYETGVWSDEDTVQTGFFQADDLEHKVTGGLYGSAEILNIEASTQMAYDALAIDNFIAEDGELADSIHAFPGTLDPSLTTGKSNFAVFKNGDFADMGNSRDAVSAILMKKSISNNYVLDEGRGSETNWVVTFPTKRLHVFDVGSTALAPFKKVWAGAEPNAKSCHEVKVKYWDNEEYSQSSGDIDFSPSLPGKKNALCYETNILTFNKAKVLGGEFVSYNVNLPQPDFKYGWMNIAFDGYTLPVPSTTDEVVEGLPVIGFSAVTIKNNKAQNGVMNNYGSSTDHKADTTHDAINL